MANFCKHCGNSVTETARFCSACGAELLTPAPVSYPRAAARPLIRPRAGRMIAGVCQGIANQYGWDPAWVRTIAVLAALFGGGLGAVAYVILWIVTPEEPFLLPSGQSYPSGS